MSIAQLIPENIKRVSRSLGYILWLDTPNDWQGLPIIFKARLNVRQRVGLAFMALKSLDRSDAIRVAEMRLSGSAGNPIAPLFNHMDEAAFWADLASPEELDAYCLASFQSMTRGRQSDFLNYVGERNAA